MSLWALPITIVNKPSGKIRKCEDYRKLNNITIGDAYPMPVINEILEKYRIAKYFTSVDATLKFWQIEIEEKDKKKTAFTT